MQGADSAVIRAAQPPRAGWERKGVGKEKLLPFVDVGAVAEPQQELRKHWLCDDAYGDLGGEGGGGFANEDRTAAMLPRRFLDALVHSAHLVGLAQGVPAPEVVGPLDRHRVDQYDGRSWGHDSGRKRNAEPVTAEEGTEVVERTVEELRGFQDGDVPLIENGV